MPSAPKLLLGSPLATPRAHYVFDAERSMVEAPGGVGTAGGIQPTM